MDPFTKGTFHLPTVIGSRDMLVFKFRGSIVSILPAAAWLMLTVNVYVNIPVPWI